jgi:D-arabinose 1-dehydrogenase-like Zn-dependent alcohol dehydrogenase
MIEKMEAVVYTAPNEMTFFPEYKSTQQDRKDDVLLKIESVGICGSDMHAFHGKIHGGILVLFLDTSSAVKLLKALTKDKRSLAIR